MTERRDSDSHRSRPPFWRVVMPGYLLAAVVASVLGSIVQTQFNLGQLGSLGADIAFGERIGTTLFDLGSFGPTLLALTAVTFGVALPVASLISRFLPRYSGVLYFLAGFIGIWVAFRSADAVLPMPTLVAATRGWFGLLLMMAAAGFGSWLFARIVRGRSHGRAR
jgi:hypothetical protein